jgi:hypothetical protein
MFLTSLAGRPAPQQPHAFPTSSTQALKSAPRADKSARSQATPAGEAVAEGEKPPRQPTAVLPVLLRLTWMTWGNAALFFCAVYVAEGSMPVISDFMVLLSAGLLVAVRYADIVLFNGETADGEPATIAHWRNYAIAVTLSASALWAIASLISHNGWI